MTDTAPALTIRPATDADWPAIWSIMRAVIATGDTYTLAPEATEGEGRYYWCRPGSQVHVAELDGAIVGTSVFRTNQPGLGNHVANAGYMVRPGHHGRGIGGALGAHSLDAARALGFEAMQFNAVVSTNTRAVRLWERLGFSIIGTVPRAFRHRTMGDVGLHIMHRFL